MTQQKTESEQIASDFLAGYDLMAEKYTKQEMRELGKTPDFRVSRGAEFQFYCEVKETTDADPLEDHFVDLGKGIHVAEQFKVDDRSRAYRLAKRIHQSVRQFDSVNADLVHPNVMIIVNTDEMCDHQRLTDLLVGHSFVTNGCRISLSPKCAHEQVREDCYRIHLYIWLNQVQNEKYYRFLFWDKHDEQTGRLRMLFGKD